MQMDAQGQLAAPSLEGTWESCKAASGYQDDYGLYIQKEADSGSGSDTVSVGESRRLTMRQQLCPPPRCSAAPVPSISTSTPRPQTRQLGSAAGMT